MMRLDYRYLRLVSVPGFLVALVLLVAGPAAVDRADPARSTTAARRAGCSLGRCRRCTRPSSPSWRWSSTSPTGSPGAASRPAACFGGMLPFLLIVGPVLAAGPLEPDLGTMGVIALTAFTMFFVAGASLWQLALLHAGRRRRRGLHGRRAATTRWTASTRSSIRGPIRRASATTPSRACSRWARAALFGIGLGQSRQPGALHLPQAQNDFVFAVVGQELGLDRRRRRDRPVPASSPTAASASPWPRPIRSAPCWRSASPPG